MSESRINILGVGVSAINMDSACARIEQTLREGGKGYVCVTGVHGIMESQRDPDLKGVLNRALLNTPDGMPTVWIGKLHGHKEMRRVYGPDLMREICRRSVDAGWRHFLYGGDIGVAEALRASLEEQYPGIQVVGTYTPPFRALNEDERNELMNQVSESRPDLIWVGISTPKQERFMAEMLDSLDTHVLLGVGAAFDFISGRSREAPAWMMKSGLQWLFRLLMEPKRLWKRYLVNNTVFVVKAGCQLAKIKRYELH